MWTKTIEIKYKNKSVKVMCFLAETTLDDLQTVQLRAFFHDLYIQQEITFYSRYEAFNFIKHFGSEYARDFFIMQATTEGCFDNN